jgi:hypothetical protein
MWYNEDKKTPEQGGVIASTRIINARSSNSLVAAR